MYAEFDLVAPKSLFETLDVLASPPDGERLALAGGTSALVEIRSGKLWPRHVVSLDALAELRFIREENGGLLIGARTTVTDLLASSAIAAAAPSLVDACRLFGGQMVRNAATIGGNIGAGSPAEDLVPPLLSLDADVELTAKGRVRRVKLADYFLGYKTDVRRSDELITAVFLPKLANRHLNRFFKLARRHGDAITIIGIATTVAIQDGACHTANIAIGSAAPFPMRAKRAEALVLGTPLSRDTIEAAADQAMQECSPIDDVRASADYRREMVRVLTRRSLTLALEQLT
jgi:xanthine dehydrogenase FAD-binding subunit